MAFRTRCVSIGQRPREVKTYLSKRMKHFAPLTVVLSLTFWSQTPGQSRAETNAPPGEIPPASRRAVASEKTGNFAHATNGAPFDNGRHQFGSRSQEIEL